MLLWVGDCFVCSVLVWAKDANMHNQKCAYKDQEEDSKPANIHANDALIYL